MLSVLIRTLDEEAGLPRCLASVGWSDDLVVVDSGSTDGTCRIAEEAGARVYTRRMDDEAAHLNWISESVPFRHPWVYYADADEVVTPELADELRAVTAEPSRTEVAYRLRFRTMFLGRWIRHASLYPTWVLRLFRPGRVRWHREVNTSCVADGPTGRLEGHFLHYAFGKGFNAWFEKHNRYSWHEAREARAALESAPPALTALLSRDPVERRAALKAASLRLPMRPACRFLYMYVVRGGFLDGRPGLLYCQLLAAYERMIDAKIEELRRRAAGLPL
jgi:glycosyltransferase involved in cell wall biosynthesis